jgi:4'-phosphopantetheinyl transferase
MSGNSADNRLLRKRLLQRLDSEVHVWYNLADEESVTGQLDAFENVLSAEEFSKYRAIKHPKSQQSYLTAHAMLRSVLSKYVDRPAVEWQFTRGEHGKPLLCLTDGLPDIRFNLTHTDGLTACVVSLQGDCGIDVERHDTVHRFKAVSQRMFADEECRFLLDHDFDAAMFYRLWTLREAYVKALGLGLIGSTKDFYFQLDRKLESARLVHRKQSKEDERWSFKLFEPVPGYQLSVALDASLDARVRLSRFSFD